MQVMNKEDGKNILRILWTREENVATLVSGTVMHCLENGLQAGKWYWYSFPSDRGILLTMGDGLSGSLGHGDTSDVGRLRMVESLLGVAVAEVACGAHHILARSVDGAVYAWGCGADGR